MYIAWTAAWCCRLPVYSRWKPAAETLISELKLRKRLLDVLFRRGGMVVPESREREREQLRTTIAFFLPVFQMRLESKSSSLSDSKGNSKGLPNPDFYFLCLWRVLQGGRLELLLYETSALFETTFKMLAWPTLCGMEKKKVKNDTTSLKQSWCNSGILSENFTITYDAL